MARIILALILFGSLMFPIPNNSTSQNPEPCEPLSWSQWGMNPQHTGMMPVAGQRAEKVFADILIDRHVNQEIKNSGGIPVHYQSALVDGDDVFLEFKAGQYTGPENWHTQSWGEMRYQWKNNRLVKRWSFLSDWKPVPNGPVPHGGPGFEPVFHAVLANDFLYVPGFGGTVHKLNRENRTTRPTDQSLRISDPRKYFCCRSVIRR